jgi:anti-sigma factor RsiW
MNLPCDEIQRCIPWLLDDELDPEQSLEVEAHLGACATCRALLAREGQLRLVLRRAAASVAVPLSLRNRIHEAMERERRGATGWSKTWPAVAAAAILLSFIWKGGNGGLPGDLEELARRHARDLPMDVVAPDVAQVQSYLSGKLPFAVQLPKLAAEEPMKLLGGRIIQLNDRDAAYVRYDTPHGRVSMVVYEDGASAPQVVSEVAPMYHLGDRAVLVKRVRGYTAAQWKSSGLVYSVVTDLPENEFTLVLHDTVH